MQETIFAMRANNVRVTVLAPTSDAAKVVLVGEGFHDAETVQRFLVDEVMQEKSRGSVLWVDEANLVSVKDMKRLTDLAERIGARLVLSGDSKQHGSVERGDTLRVLRDFGNVQFVHHMSSWRY